MKKRNIGLALSGGGFRASIFHMGVLKYLAEKNKLEEISYISSVSGGSLLREPLIINYQEHFSNLSRNFS